MTTVTVLMSTYNGHKYLLEQLDSLLQQKDVIITIVVRDDGSSDNTLELLFNFKNEHHHINMVIFQGENRGVTKSFEILCKEALKLPPTDYYAFCDQDDVWDSDKLITAINKLDLYAQNEPNLYFSNLRMVNEDLTFMRNLFEPGEVKIGSPMALIQVFTYGCTCVFNRKGLEDFCAIPSNEMFHDHWIFELCTYLGNVYYDETPHISYRQHGTNESGAKSRGIGLILVRLHTLFFKGLHHNFEISAKQILFFSDRIKPQYFDYVYKIANYRKNFRLKCGLLFSSTYKTGNFTKDLIIKFRILINKL